MKRILIIIGIVAFAALFFISGTMIYRELAERKQSADAFDEITALVREDPAPAPQASSGTSEEPRESLSAYEKYAAVYAANEDFVGWIAIEGTRINYPVMQTPEEPNFYLKHGFDRASSRHGVPYVQENCTVGKSDNLVIHGHHMKDGSMFAGLCDYESEAFYREHPDLRFDTLSDYGTYEIIAVFKTSGDVEKGFPFYAFVDAQNAAEFEEYVDACKSLALYETGVSATYGDHLLTLATCEYSQKNGRMVIVAKKIESQ